MKHSVRPSIHPFTRALAWTLSALLAAPGPLGAALTEISDEPLAQPPSSVKPNIMLILDDSLSMELQATPDYLTRAFGSYAPSNPYCFGTATSSSISTTLNNCEVGDPPLHSNDVNGQYYDPETRYEPAVDYTGAPMTSMTSANTAGWTAVPTDGVSSIASTPYRKTSFNLINNNESSATNNADLAAGFPDRIWCNSSTAGLQDTASNFTGSPPVCVRNNGYNYPNSSYFGGGGTDASIRRLNGAPYYYRIVPTEYCTDITLTDCTATTTPTGAYIVPARVRYCDSTALTNCQAKRRGSFTRPKFTGKIAGPAAATPGKVGIATITVGTQADSAGGRIASISVNGVNITDPLVPIDFAGPITTTTAATAIRDAINAYASTPEYHATVSGSTVTVRYGPDSTAAPTPTANGSPSQSTGTPGVTPNGFAFAINFGALTHTGSPTTTFTLSSVSTNDSINGVSVGGLSSGLIPSTLTCNSGSSCPTSPLSARNSHLAGLLRTAINDNTSAGLNHGFSASGSGAQVIVTAPAGSAYNGKSVSVSDSGVTVTFNSPTSANFNSDGITAGNIDLSPSTFGEGQDVADAVALSRTDLGTFERTDIVPESAPGVAKTFTKYAARSDCSGALGAGGCSYDEEMTNFANWFSYYRFRMAMAKTAIGRAFSTLGPSYRVGGITINPGGTSTTFGERFIAVDDFKTDSGEQKDLWYQWLYKQKGNGSTPLREALSRVGRYYAGKTTGINANMGGSPITLACQPNFAILVTDGYYFSDPGGLDLDGTAIGNVDNVNSGFSLRSEARYDGNLLPTTFPTTSVNGGKGTLADVALYYYREDLSSFADQVPTSQRDPNPKQHMTTFTVGLGLSGQLNFHPAYESGASPDFERLKTAPASGGLDWPAPKQNDETALDDLWHAAVNGRGTFFSAQNPNDLATAIRESLDAVAARTGAGAAAATSNLQPIAGDNFAFTAQFETSTWIGDIKARTIDLSTGTVASRVLWSAAPLLDQRGQQTRKIYTFDAGDTAAVTEDLAAMPPVAAQNGNRLKSFCWVDGSGDVAAYTGCSEVQGLSAAEMDYFLPTVVSPGSGEPALTQTPTLTVNGTTGDATKERLIDFLRGDLTNQVVIGGTSSTDLFRRRVSVMGDIINAQPAYVKKSPFSYDTGNFFGRDPYYQTFRNSGLSATRKGTVYVASNDGFLHAFHTDPDNDPYFQTAGIGTTSEIGDEFTGTLDTSPTAGEGSERWAYVPGITLPKMKRLADTPYLHQYYADGTPVVGDVCFGHTEATRCAAATDWRTILVAGLNAGGRGYYALDVTDPDNPKALWELKGGAGAACIDADSDVDGTQTEDCNIGLTYGNPLIVKRKSDGKWVVIVTSGYNNVGADASEGDGDGHLYVLDAQTGEILQRMSTAGAGDTTTPSGLGRINAWVDNAAFDNTALTVYGGDLLGNLWRFQLEDLTGTPAIPNGSVTRIATLKGPGNTAQQLTTKPELGEVSGKRVIFVGTGRFLGTGDKTDIGRQSIYAIKDDMASVTSPTVAITRSGSHPTSTVANFVKQTLAASTVNPTTERTVATVNGVNFADSTVRGWFVDLPDGATIDTAPDPDVVTAGAERVNVDPILQLGTLVVASNIPSADTCVAGGFGWINFLDYKTGAQVPGATANMASTKVTGSLVVGINVVQLPGGTVKAIVTTADNQQLTKDAPVAPSALQGRRVSWREIFFE